MARKAGVPDQRLTWIEGGKYTARSRYDTSELSVDEGTKMLVTEADLGSGWIWCRDTDGHEGWVPTRCVEPTPPL